MDFWVGFWIGTLVHSAVCCGLAAKLAKVKGHDEVEWALFGFFFGLLGLMAAVGLPDHHNARSRVGLGNGSHDGTVPPPPAQAADADPLAAWKRLGAKIKRDEQGEVVGANLYNTQLTDAGLAHLKALTTLQTLDLPKQITDAGLAHLKALTNLQTLYLYETQITDAGLVHLKGLTSLQTLRLDLTQITDAGLVHLKGLTGLQLLYVSNTKITDAGVADLQKALPNCEISK